MKTPEKNGEKYEPIVSMLSVYLTGDDILGLNQSTYLRIEEFLEKTFIQIHFRDINKKSSFKFTICLRDFGQINQVDESDL